MRLFGKDVTNWKVVEKIIISVTDKFEAKIENSCDLKAFSIAKFVNKFEVHEERVLIRIDELVKNAF